MKRLLGFVGCSIGGAIGWALGEPFGIFAAFMVSMVGTAAGYFAGWKVADRLLD